MSNYYCLECGSRIELFDDESAGCTGCYRYWEPEDKSFWKSISYGPNLKT